VHRYLESYQWISELSTVSRSARRTKPRVSQAWIMDPKHLIRLNYLRGLAFVLVAIAWLNQVPATARAEATSEAAWSLPLKPYPKLINTYRQANSDYSSGHRGVDYLVSLGQEVLSPATGTVHFAGKVVNRRLISILAEGEDAYLFEVEPVCSDFSEGQAVKAGQVIGLVCEPDASYLQHCQAMRCLHFSLRRNGTYLSPLVPIDLLQPSRLLPWS